MSDLTIAEIKAAAPSWGPAELLMFLQSELADEPRKTALEAVLVEHAPTLVEALDAQLNPPKPEPVPEPEPQKTLQVAQGALRLVGELQIQAAGQIVIADLDHIDHRWASLRSRDHYVYVQGDPDEMERIRAIRRAKKEHVLEDGTWRIPAQDRTQAKAKASQITMLANQKKLQTIEVASMPAGSPRALAADATRDGRAAIVTKPSKKANEGFTAVAARYPAGSHVQVYEDGTGRILIMPSPAR